MTEHEINPLATNQTCAASGEEISYADEVYLLQVVQPWVALDGGVSYTPPLSEDGDYLYEPVFFLLEGWEESYESLMEHMEDTPPWPDNYSILECSICESGIRAGETMGLASFGEIHRSVERCSDSGMADHFEDYDTEPTVLCIVCLKKLNEDVVEIWSSVGHDDECDEGTAVRCWRYGCASGTCLKEESSG